MREFCVSVPVIAELLAAIVTLIKSVNTSAGINQLLLTRKERMALRTDFYSDILLSGAGRDFVSASASDNGFLICGVDTLLHYCHLNLLFNYRYCPNLRTFHITTR